MTSKRLTDQDIGAINNALATSQREFLLKGIITEGDALKELYYEHLPNEVSDPIQSLLEVLTMPKKTFDQQASLKFNIERGVRPCNYITASVPYDWTYEAHKFAFPNLAIYSSAKKWGVTADSRKPLDMPIITSEHPIHDALEVWARRKLRVNTQERIINRVRYNIINKACTTTGHIMRVWPKIVDLLPDELANTLSDAKRSSPMPSGLAREDLFWLPLVTKWLTHGLLIRNYKRSHNNDGNTDSEVHMDVDIDSTIEQAIVHDAEVGNDPYKIAQEGLM